MAEVSSGSGHRKLGRRLSRRLSMVTKMPNLIGTKLRSEFGSRDSLAVRRADRRTIEITVIAPDKSQRILQGERSQSVCGLISLLLAEHCVVCPRLSLAGSRAEVDPCADISLLEGDVLIVDEGFRLRDPRAENDARFRLCEQFCREERWLCVNLASASELYGYPLRRTGCLGPAHHDLVFEPLAALAAAGDVLVQQMNQTLAIWDSCYSRVGHLFSQKWWAQLEEYQNTYRRTRQFLRERVEQDEDFTEVCRLRRGAARYTLQAILHLPVQRLAQYEQYFQSLLQDTAPDHPDHEPLSHAKARAKQAVKRGQEESDLERIQDLFPNDCLRLYDKDVVTMKMKGLMRKRSSTAARLQRALSAKSLRPESPPRPAPQPAHDKRTFIMEAPVQFTTGVQSQERHLFLFNDLLLVAKARTGGNFKLKDKVRVSELWLSKGSLDDVTEINKSADTSFVLGWPTTNVVATFTTQAARDLWWSTLQDVLAKEKDKDPRATNIQVTYYDLSTAIEYCKTFSVGPDQTARDCVKLALGHLELRGADPALFQLWAKTARDEAPYPLIGHERPFAIKLSCLRDGLSSEEGFDLDHCNNLHDPLARCHFILRSTVKSCDSEVKKSCKKSGGRMKIGHVFRRSLSKESAGCLFGLPLGKICEGENLPRPVMSMLQQLVAKGPFTQGIFRKSANARLVRELRDKLDASNAGGEGGVEWAAVPVLTVAALFKEFLRSLPDPLLGGALYSQWREAAEMTNAHHKLITVKGLLSQLPACSHALLCHFLCVLHHVARRSQHNLMSAANLGVCVGPSLLWPAGDAVADLRAVPSVVEYLITHCQLLCGAHLPHLLGDPRDSGTEESDSLRRDDSSIDSLECSPPPRKDKMSLSRDSGLTMSDSQLYTADEEESGSSSSGYDPAFDSTHHTKVTATMSVPAEYVRVYGGWEERINPNFQRQAWFRQRSRRLSSITPSTKIDEAVRRSASEESLLDTAPPPTPPRRNKPDAIPEISPRKSEPNIKCGEMNGDSIYAESKFGRHPPLRKVTAVHCEVVDQTPRSHYKDASHSSIYGVNGVKLSLSSADLNSSPVSSKDQSFVSRSSDLSYSQQRIQESYRTPLKSVDQSFSRSLDQSYSSSNLYNQSTRSSDSATISDQSIYSSPKTPNKVVLGFGDNDYYYAVKKNKEEGQVSECDDSSTLSDDDCTPHVSRSNSRGNEVTTKLRHLPPVHVDTCYVRGRLKRKEERARAAHRSRSLPPPPPYRPPPPAAAPPTNRRAPITSYYLGDCSQSQRYIVTRSFLDEESYV